MRPALSPDKPLTDPQEDRLGYASFAKHLAESISKMVPAEGFVIAVYGSWGSGKTTVLNFVTYYLRQKPLQEQPIIISFNPWWFAGKEDLVRQFFEQIESSLKRRGDIIKKLAALFGHLGSLVSEVPASWSWIGKVLQKLYPRNRNVHELKGQISELLREQARRILIVMDDIDRLSSDEMQQIFQVIKAIADFPNLIYLLAFDHRVVARALTDTQGISGEQFLEKIVQASFVLPMPDKTLLRNLLLENLDAVLAGTPEELFDATYWGNVYYEGIDPFISTPRDIVRLCNALQVTYPPVKGEVNPVDFIAIEMLRLFCPIVYETIRNNQDYFVGIGTAWQRPNYLKQFHDSWLDNVPSTYREAVRRLMIRLFPRLESVWSNIHYGGDWERKWRKYRRVCSAEVYPIYFQFALPEGDISCVEMKSILALAGNPEAFSEMLINLSKQHRPDGTTRLRTFLQHLEDYTEQDIPVEHIPAIIASLFEVGDLLLVPEDEARHIFDFGNKTMIGRVMWQLLRRLSEPERFEILRKAMQNGKAIGTIVDNVAVLGQQHGKYSSHPDPESERLVTSAHLSELEQLALGKIRDSAKSGELMNTSNLPGTLYYWRDCAGDNEPREWCRKVIGTAQGALRFLEHFLVRTMSQSFSDTVGKAEYRLKVEWLKEFVDTMEIAKVVSRLPDGLEITDTQLMAVQQFLAAVAADSTETTPAQQTL